MLMGEKFPVSDGKHHPSSLLGNADNLSENFDARVNISLSFLVEKAADAILKVTEERELQIIGQQRMLTNIV
jgi:hypothetical protein